jgi:hypothetical protein
MMVELRWKDRQRKENREVYPGYYGGPMMEKIVTYTVLQYRQTYPCTTEWSDWIDVPTEVE